MPPVGLQREHYDELVRTRRPTRYGLSCGYTDRYDPTLLERRPALRRALTALFDRVLPTQIGTMLDLACGTAYYWSLLATRCDRLFGVELSPVMAAAGQEHLDPNLHLRNHVVSAEAQGLPLASASIDVVLAVDALHHVDDLRRVVAEMDRVLKPAGLLVAVEPNIFNPVVFAAHLLPPEERGALWPNNPWAVERSLSEFFEEVSVQPVTYVSGIQSARALRFVERLTPLFDHRPLSSVALRRVYRGRSR